jgi:K+/H+ antiporter YhaU regulatory subunit KhtT
LKNDGKRELYYFPRAADEEPRTVITPTTTRRANSAPSWAAPTSGRRSSRWRSASCRSSDPCSRRQPWIGYTLAEVGFRAKTGITVIAILCSPEPITGAQPSDTIERGDTLVTVGKAGRYPEFPAAAQRRLSGRLTRR